MFGRLPPSPILFNNVPPALQISSSGHAPPALLKAYTALANGDACHAAAAVTRRCLQLLQTSTPLLTDLARLATNGKPAAPSSNLAACSEGEAMKPVSSSSGSGSSSGNDSSGGNGSSGGRSSGGSSGSSSGGSSNSSKSADAPAEQQESGTAGSSRTAVEQQLWQLHHRLSSSPALQPLRHIAGINTLSSLCMPSDTDRTLLDAGHGKAHGSPIHTTVATSSATPLGLDELCQALLFGAGEGDLQLPLSGKQHLALQYRASKKTLLWDCVMRWAVQQSLETVAEVF